MFQVVDISVFFQLGDEWLVINFYIGNEFVIKIGDFVYNQNCVCCYGLEVIFGGIMLDLCKLNDENEFFS